MVIATARNVDKMAALSDSIHKIALDVTSDESVQLAVKQAMLLAGRIDILINNAGVECCGKVYLRSSAPIHVGASTHSSCRPTPRDTDGDDVVYVPDEYVRTDSDDPGGLTTYDPAQEWSGHQPLLDCGPSVSSTEVIFYPYLTSYIASQRSALRITPARALCRR
jgi:hypothetical protein